MKRYLSPAFRRLLLGGAVLAATLFSLLPAAAPVETNGFVTAAVGLKSDPQDFAVLAQATPDPKTAADSARSAAREARDAARDAAATAREAARKAVANAKEAARKAVDAEAEADADVDTASNDRPGRRKGLRIGLHGLDRQYDSFDQFLDADPPLATMVLGIVFIVFLTPVLLVALLIWYKMRKTRMLNEAMLKLAEKGIVPPGEALEALQSGRIATAMQSGPGTMSLFAQAKALRSRAAWSDLRKGVLLGAVGFAWTISSIFDGRSPNWLGLALLFVGVGYVALAYFENRQAAAIGSAPTGGPGDVNN